MNLLPINENDLRIDIDRFVWVWNTLEHVIFLQGSVQKINEPASDKTASKA